jgi:3-oxoacyl-[acyl-carrier-protein] synthase-3
MPVEVATRAGLAAAAYAVPDRVVDNEAIAEQLDVDGSWVVRRTGIRERRFVSDGESVVSLATLAGRRSLALAGLEAAELCLVLVATSTHVMIVPNAAPLVAAELGATRAAAMDVGAACTGWLSALQLAVGQVEAGRAERVLVIGVDVISPIIDRADRATAPLFADAAGAAVVSRTEGSNVVGPVVLGVDPAGAHLVTASHEEGLLHMIGQETFSSAVEHLAAATRAAVQAAGVELDDIDVFVYHQANARILSAVGEQLGLDPGRVVNTVERFGNSSAGTIPLTLAIGTETGVLREGQLVLLGAFGAGFTWGAAVVRWGG